MQSVAPEQEPKLRLVRRKGKGLRSGVQTGSREGRGIGNPGKVVGDVTPEGSRQNIHCMSRIAVLQRACHLLGSEGTGNEVSYCDQDKPREPREVRRDRAQPRGQKDTLSQGFSQGKSQAPGTLTHALWACTGAWQALKGILASEMAS